MLTQHHLMYTTQVSRIDTLVIQGIFDQTINMNTSLSKFTALPSFHKESPLVFKYSWLDQHNIWDS